MLYYQSKVHLAQNLNCIAIACLFQAKRSYHECICGFHRPYVPVQVLALAVLAAARPAWKVATRSLTTSEERVCVQ